MRTKSLMAVVILAALTTGCSQNEITEMSPDARPAMNFGVYTGVQTRGEVMDDTWLKKAAGVNGGGLGVLAYHTKQTAWSSAKSSSTPNFMYNQKVEWSSGSSAFAYTPLKYWPNTEGDKISFFAYAPYDTDAASGAIDNGIVLSAYTAQSDPTLTFTLKTAANNLVDLVATNATQTSGDNQVIDVIKRIGDIKFKLNHVLTRATFSAKLDNSISATGSATHVCVTGVRILGTAARTDASNTGNNVAENNASKFYTKALYKFVDGTWNYNTAGQFEVSSNPYELTAVLNTAGKSYGGYTTSSIEVPQGGTAVSLLKTDEYLFLIPVNDATTPAGITAATDVRVQIDYDIVTVDASLSAGHSITSTTATVSLPNGTLKRAEAYKFTFTIGLNAVTVSAEVAPWTDKGEVFIPSATSATTGKTDIQNAITAMNTAKTNNPNCNYFVIDVTGTGTVALTSLSATNAAFKSGDKIELNFLGAVTASNGTVSMTGWTVTGSLTSQAGKIILTKN